MLRGETEEADTYLQMSARWGQSESPVHTIAALNNLGVASYWLLGPATPGTTAVVVGSSASTSSERFFDAQREQRDFTSLPISKHNNRYTSANSNDSSNSSGIDRQLSQADINRIRVAMDYWTEAVNVPVDSSSASVNSAAAVSGCICIHE